MIVLNFLISLVVACEPWLFYFSLLGFLYFAVFAGWLVYDMFKGSQGLLSMSTVIGWSLGWYHWLMVLLGLVMQLGMLYLYQASGSERLYYVALTGIAVTNLYALVLTPAVVYVHNRVKQNRQVKSYVDSRLKELEAIGRDNIPTLTERA